jgi:hypothetical protein
MSEITTLGKRIQKMDLCRIDKVHDGSFGVMHALSEQGSFSSYPVPKELQRRFRRSTGYDLVYIADFEVWMKTAAGRKEMRAYAQWRDQQSLKRWRRRWRRYKRELPRRFAAQMKKPEWRGWYRKNRGWLT